MQRTPLSIVHQAVIEQLGLSADTHIGPEDDLITFGLDSIRMMTIAGRWRSQGLDIGFADLVATPTLGHWAQLMHDAQTANQTHSADETATAHTSTDTASTASNNAPTSADRNDDHEPFPLAPMQHAYWIGGLDGYDTGDGPSLGGVSAHLYVELDGPAQDPAQIDTAVEKLVRRHAMLRTILTGDGRQQVLADVPEGIVKHQDLREADADTRDTVLARTRENGTHQRLSQDFGRMIDLVYTLLPNNRARLHLDVDMIAADAMSYRIIVDELAGYLDGDEQHPLRYRYKNYLAHPSVANPPHRERDQAWWRDKASDMPGAPELPLVDSAAVARARSATRRNFFIDHDQREALYAHARTAGVTPAMALAAAFAEAIGAFATSPKFLLNLPLFNREQVDEEVNDIVGDFSSSILIDVDLSTTGSIYERVKDISARFTTNVAHHSYGALNVLRDIGHARATTVLAPVVYTSAVNLGELFSARARARFGDPVWIISQGPQVLLDAQVTELDGGLLLNWDLREEAFRPGIIDAMFATYTRNVSALVEGEHTWSQPFPLAADEADLQARKSQETTLDVSGAKLHDRLFVHAETTPEALAMISIDAEPNGALSTRSWTYRQLADEALAIAATLIDAGVQPGDRVIVGMPKGCDQVTAVVGTLAAAAIYVPVNPEHPLARRQAIATQSGAKVILGTDASIEAFADEQFPPFININDARSHHTPLSSPVDSSAEDVAYLLFTSGSTGEPKGVEIPHRAAMNTLDGLNSIMGTGPEDSMFALSALEFDISVQDMFSMFAAGGTVVIPDATVRTNPDQWAQAITLCGVTHLCVAPSLLDMLLSTDHSFDLSSLRTVMSGGDWVPVDLPERLKKRAPECRFFGLGGTTETGVHSTICEVTEINPEWKVVPYGVPLPNMHCRIVDAIGRDRPTGVIGQLLIGGPGVGCGYRGLSDERAHRFFEENGTRWFATGDLARYLPDGTMEFIGRMDHQVQLRGYRVELGEVEACLRQHPQIHRAVAHVINDPSAHLVAAVGLIEDPHTPAPTQEELIAWCQQLLPSYMVPEFIAIANALPVTINGKLDRRGSHALIEEHKKNHQASAVPTDAGHVEPQVVELVAQVLADSARISTLDPDADFFASGGDSVTAIRAVGAVRDMFAQPQLGITELFSHRSARGLAAAIVRLDPYPGYSAQVADIAAEVAAMGEDELKAHLDTTTS
ncbi:MAG: amino acid adenylation domain-containing protein [Corynebacterium sp.]|uniref:non-ribosomal peptide synthetase n=1 Tax=Corynebacterium sp. TaxID=1720 RepID=UPI0026DC3D75|nr:amino acid adenylation domain-containing protein [Corynebacterium sp.]MDO4760468.1 amino acid adenylation domain-containing protein [Corynebacterium sp.]